MIENIKWLGHSTVKFLGDTVIYVDPYNIKESFNDADIIFITHDHYDHFSKDDIEKCRKTGTKIVITSDLLEDVKKLDFKSDEIIEVVPNSSYSMGKIKFYTVPAYNINKEYHKKEYNWVGYIIEINNVRYYIAGDTDITEENKKVKCDVAFLPIGGTFTMDYKEAAMLANEIKPKMVIPIHYGMIVGSKEDGNSFKELLNKDIKCEIL